MRWETINKFIISLSLSALVLTGCSFDNLNSKENEKTKSILHKENKIEFNVKDKAYYGEKEAPNEIVVFGDYECGACQSFHADTMDKIKKEYIQTGKAKLYLFDLAFISEISLIKALLAVSFEKENPQYYTKYVDAMYDLSQVDSAKLSEKAYVNSKLKELFPDLDTEKIVDKVFIEDKSLMDVIKKNKQLVDENDIKSTPAVFVNGVKLDNPFDLNELKNNLYINEGSN